MAEDKGLSLNELYHKIQTLITEERWQEAHRACLEILHIDPDNIKALHFKIKIEREVEKINISVLNEDLENLEPLWKEKQYEKLLLELKELTKYSTSYPPLLSAIEKAQKGYEDQLMHGQENAFDQEKARIEQSIKDLHFPEAMRGAQHLRIARIREKEVHELVNRIRSTWVDHELRRLGGLLSTKKFEEILLALQHIQHIDPDSEKIKKYINETQKKYKAFKLDEKKDFIYQGIEKIRTLVQLKKYAKAVEAAHEILEIDPENKQALKLFSTAKQKLQKTTRSELYDQMKKSRKEMKEQYTKTKDDYIKL